MPPARLPLVALMVLAVAGLMGACPGRLKTIVIDVPVETDLFEDVPSVVSTFTRVGNNFDETTVEARIDGVDLIAALGLVWPFADASGVVMIGATPVTVSGFHFNAAIPRQVFFDVTGLPPGSHSFEVTGERKNGFGSFTDDVGFDVTGPMTLEADVIAASGLPLGPEEFGAEGVLVNAALGQPLAAPPVALSDGGELREGFVPVAEGRIAGAP